jgi:hypothetical protein
MADAFSGKRPAEDAAGSDRDNGFERAAEDGELSGDAKVRANHTFSESSWT